MLPGMPLKEAESRWPGVTFRPDEPKQYGQAFDEVLEILDSFSPIVETRWDLLEAFTSQAQTPTSVAQAGVAFLDATGLESLYGPDTRLGRRIARDIVEMLGYEVRVGMAASRFGAYVAALLCEERLANGGVDHGAWTVSTSHRVVRAAYDRHSEQRAAGEGPLRGEQELQGSLLVVPAGQERNFLASLPIRMLPLPVEARIRLGRLGVHTLGEFAALPANAVRHRFGAEGLRVLALASGEDRQPPRPRPRPLQIHDAIEFEWVEESLDRLTFALKQLTDRLSARLTAHGLACGRVRVRWKRENGSVHEATVGLAERSAGGQRLLEHLRWHVEGLRLDSGVAGISIEALELGGLEARQLDLLPGDDGRLPNHERLEHAGEVLARLRARWGDAATLQAELVASRRMEQAFRWRDVALQPAVAAKGPRKKGRKAASSPAPSPPLESAGVHGSPLWLLPEGDAVEVSRGGEDARGQRRPPLLKRGQQTERIERTAGPWRLLEPWGQAPLARDEYNAVTSSGGAYWLEYDRASETWRVRGVFD